MSLKDRQVQVKDFVEENELEGTVEFRIMDLVSEVGEIVKDATKSADYGMKKDSLEIKEDEIGDVLFSLFTVCNDLDIDTDEALDEALQKYERRLDERGDPGSE